MPLPAFSHLLSMRFVSTTIIALLAILCMSRLPKFLYKIPADRNSFQTYIVHVKVPDELTSKSEDLESWYRSFLPPATKASSGEEEASLVYSYRHVMKGFAARLTPDQVKDMEKNERFISARPEEILSIATTRSPNFLGLEQDKGFWKDANYGEGVIIGVLDGGIFPYHSSFGSGDMPPPPGKWKGRCDFNLYACSNKLIGARYFRSGQPGIPYDDNGHGTHVAGIAAGNFVAGANIFNQASGTAAGIAPRAHLAIYKVCHADIGCPESDILAGMDAAIDDGVDVLSISLGGGPSDQTINDGAYNAVKKGIFVSCSAGNAGPAYSTVNNDAPWILTVGASTTDRKLRVTAVLGNNDRVVGEAVYQPINYLATPLRLTYTGSCSSETFIGEDARGWVVACDKSVESISTVIGSAQVAGAEAVIIMDQQSVGATNQLDAYSSLIFPAIQVSYDEGVRIKNYIQSMQEKATTTLIFEGTVFEEDHAPTVASFSSRGPSKVWPLVLKPDILGPGVNILAASPSTEGNINRFVFMSGTSMACPHLSGVAALLKRVHPDWSPAAIKSAIMTTADVVNRAGKPIEDQTLQPADLFATGAGHVNPSKATNPGLVYDVDVAASKHDWELNYPSFSIVFGPGMPDVQKYTRTVTNIGQAKSSYTVQGSVVPDIGLRVTVEPSRLDFTQLKQKLTYNVTFTLLSKDNFRYQGFLMWSSGTGYEVRSPFVAIVQGTGTSSLEKL